MKFLPLAALMLLPVCTVATKAQQTPMETPAAATSETQPIDDWKAVIVAPPVVSQVTTKSFPVVVTVYSLKSAPLPEYIYLRANLGRFKGEADRTLKLKVPSGGLASAIFDLNYPEIGDLEYGKTLIRFGVYDAPDSSKPRAFTEVKVRQQKLFDILQPPKQKPSASSPIPDGFNNITLAADGRSSSTATVLIKDGDGNPMGNVPCILQHTDARPKSYGTSSSAGYTDNTGKFSFELPASKEVGLSIYQVLTERLVSPQIIVSYEKPTGEKDTKKPAPKTRN